MFILATKSSVPILGQVAYILGCLMDGIFKLLDNFFGIENIFTWLGMAVFLFFIIFYQALLFYLK